MMRCGLGVLFRRCQIVLHLFGHGDASTDVASRVTCFPLREGIDLRPSV